MFLTNNLIKRTLSNFKFQQNKKLFPYFDKIMTLYQEQQRDIVSGNNESPQKTTHLERTNHLVRQKV